MFLVILFWSHHTCSVEIARETSSHRDQSAALIFYARDEAAAQAVRRIAEGVLDERGMREAVDHLDQFVPLVFERLEPALRQTAKPVYHMSPDHYGHCWNHDLWARDPSLGCSLGQWTWEPVVANA